jgi:hypothetical protein
VLYLEWHPRKGLQDRAEIRLLVGGDLRAQGLWAANVFAESNVNHFNAPGNEGENLLPKRLRGAEPASPRPQSRTETDRDSILWFDAERSASARSHHRRLGLLTPSARVLAWCVVGGGQTEGVCR